ncbi:Uncharacterized ABC transporter ATP-binding protein HI_1470 [Slackia heliotrinireducens]|uniref:ABC-type cobalamin/Fe3+-siderophore transport system, ATPase component n=1 Tax=Slackia heliotrinireducens (strain ATCC 29202 / DSM 20476 / NCTC 11029 / RHS 1) TaxID=471855 RepID=C7N2H1_SLAHD|nr:ABC transporter ATP-binding protein [Slackia heliotrinireducens]ACV23479.1 ABC-type cobalamin/Fe3+-siderophore transport system, ATPase component [Slackia heliotrinireducens DSM 20476]VEH02824.1 Uncharacterized ABC transporter ATP-binding protein HI_1470 [Slackia heliotrinireducens]
MEVLLEATDLAFQYTRDRIIFSNVSFSIGRGEILSLLGPNGAGKSTLLNCIAGLATPTHGTVKVCGQPIGEYSPRTLASHIGYVRQTISVTYGYSVREYLVMGAAPRIGMFSTPQEEDYARVDQAIADLSLEKLADRAVSELSGGERQRVAIARAIVQDPEIILFDEPTSALDYGNQIRVMRTIQQLADRGYAVIMTTHNPDQPILLGGKVAMLNYDGTLAVGDSETTLTSERLSELYGTELHLVYVDEVDRVACVSSKL